MINEGYRLSVFESGVIKSILSLSGVIKSILSLRGGQQQEGGEMYIMMKEA